MFSSLIFRSLISRLIIAGAIILISFPIGVLVYLRTLDPPPLATVQNMTPLIDRVAGHDITLHVGSEQFIIKKGEIYGWTEPYTRNYTGGKDLRFNGLVDNFITDLSKKMSRDPVDAKFVINNGIVLIITPSKNGQELNIISSADKLRQGVLANQIDITLDFNIVEPGITVEKIKSFGINNRLAVGESDFTGSSLARIQNIKVASKTYNGLIIQPKETFSFNALLGDVVASTGYAPEKVIKDGKIQYEYGGGVCQVSTTLFRAAIMAGLPIVERRPHSFPVHYYYPQGFDATIYPGSSDLKFTNDTPGPILIQTHIENKKIIFEVYGKSDGRNVTMNGPYQYDIQPDGSMKAYFTRIISFSNGASTSKTFNSIYKSPNLYTTEPNPYQ